MKTLKLEDKLFLLTFTRDERSHIGITAASVCLEQCHDKPCTYCCPADVYHWQDSHIAVSFENCVECGGCRVICPFDNIDCTIPRGGFGVRYKFG